VLLSSLLRFRTIGYPFTEAADILIPRAYQSSRIEKAVRLPQYSQSLSGRWKQEPPVQICISTPANDGLSVLLPLPLLSIPWHLQWMQ
jgi:hypothetical protein